MDYDNKKKTLEAQIARLEQIKESLYGLEDEVLAIEKDVCATDESLPSDRDMRRMPDGAERRQAQDIINLCNRAYAVIDELLGPPDEESEGPTKTLYLGDSAKKFS